MADYVGWLVVWEGRDFWGVHIAVGRHIVSGATFFQKDSPLVEQAIFWGQCKNLGALHKCALVGEHSCKNNVAPPLHILPFILHPTNASTNSTIPK